MGKPTLEQRVIREIAIQLGLSDSEITIDSTIQELGMDSLDNVEVVMALEDEFEIEIPDEDCYTWTKVSDAVDYLRETTKPSTD